jgi:hypothetical protein
MGQLSKCLFVLYPSDDFTHYRRHRQVIQVFQPLSVSTVSNQSRLNRLTGQAIASCRYMSIVG